MTTLSERGKGESVWVPCEVTDGMFPNERHIRITLPGEFEIEGFVPDQDVSEDRVRAVVAEITSDHAALLFRGEILSRTNPVLVPPSTEVELVDGNSSP